MLPGNFKCVSEDIRKLRQLFSCAVEREYVKLVHPRELLPFAWC